MYCNALQLAVPGHGCRFPVVVKRTKNIKKIYGKKKKKKMRACLLRTKRWLCTCQGLRKRNLQSRCPFYDGGRTAGLQRDDCSVNRHCRGVRFSSASVIILVPGGIHADGRRELFGLNPPGTEENKKKKASQYIIIG